jgi:two-component system, NtrC family, nitrogen regulation response regulator GlnG
MSNRSCVWIVDDDRSIRWVLEKALSKEPYQVESFENAEMVLARLATKRPDVIISDVRMPGMDGMTLLNQIVQKTPGLPVIIMTAHSDLQSAVDAYQGGAFEYLPKPFDIDEVVNVTQRALEKSRENLPDQKSPELTDSPEIIGEAPAMQEVFRAIGRLANSNVTVLINGESGTGKELVARALHRHSPRKAQPFVALNMAAIPHDLIESELFGHEKGAFTGAATKRQGRFEQADGGTLFLDEIGDMPAEAQTRLLRVLADGEFFRVGGHTSVKVDVRIITATHQNLEELVEQHKFREDLFHRLNVIRIHLPSLSQRQGDVPALINYFLQRSAQELNMEVKTVLPEAIEFLQQLSWPGNVRQLENMCRWLTVMAPGREIHLEDLPPELRSAEAQASGESGGGDWSELLQSWAKDSLNNGEENILKAATPIFEATLIETALEYTQGRKREAAEILGWGRNTLTRKLKELKMADYAEKEANE